MTYTLEIREEAEEEIYEAFSAGMNNSYWDWVTVLLEKRKPKKDF